MNNTDRLSTRVTSRLPPLVGQRLLGVTYWCLSGEATAESIRSPVFYLGGEVEMRFTTAGSIFVTWDENAGWEDHFSVQVSAASRFSLDSLQPADASTVPLLWDRHVGQRLLSCSVLGWRDTPHVLSFRFPDGEVLVGDGYGPAGSFGDGDDVLVRSGGDTLVQPGAGPAETLWTSGLA